MDSNSTAMDLLVEIKRNMIPLDLSHPSNDYLNPVPETLSEIDRIEDSRMDNYLLKISPPSSELCDSFNSERKENQKRLENIVDSLEDDEIALKNAVASISNISSTRTDWLVPIENRILSNNGRQPLKNAKAPTATTMVRNDRKRKRKIRNNVFPFILWQIVNQSRTDAIQWTSDGKKVLINYETFDKEYLEGKTYFKTTKIVSFIRQMNIYGFTKTYRTASQNLQLHEFYCPYFNREKPHLLNLMIRRTSGVIKKEKLNRIFKENRQPSKPPSTTSASSVIDPNFTRKIYHYYPSSCLVFSEKNILND